MLNALHILHAREAVVSSLTPHGGQPSSSKLTSNPILEGENIGKKVISGSSNLAMAASGVVPLASPESPSDINDESVGDVISGGGGEAPACPNDILAGKRLLFLKFLEKIAVFCNI